MKEARPGDVLVEVRCKCAGAVLVREYAVADWTCGKCWQPASPGKRFQLDDEMQLVELEQAEVA